MQEDAQRLVIEARGSSPLVLLCGGLGIAAPPSTQPMRLPLQKLLQRTEALADACGTLREEREGLEANSGLMEARLLFADIDPPDGLMREHHLHACPPLAAAVPPFVWRRALEGCGKQDAVKQGRGEQGAPTMDEAGFLNFLAVFRQPTTAEAIESWVRLLDMDGDGVLSEGDLRSCARANAVLDGGSPKGAELHTEIETRVARLHVLVQSGGERIFSSELLLAAPIDQFVRILFGLDKESLDDPEQGAR